MGFVGDERSQSVLVGSILLFGVVIILFSTYQAYSVPQQNADIEGDHLQTIDRQMHDLRNAIVSVPGMSSTPAVTLTLGTDYPTRIIAVNPPPPTGVVQTTGTQTELVNLTLSNAVGTDSETADYWNGSPQVRENGGIIYRPNYNEYENPGSLIYENTVLYSDFDSGSLTKTGQRLVNGRRLTLISLNGSLNKASSESTSLDIKAISASSTSISIINETNSNVTIRFATQRSADAWRKVLRDDNQLIDQGGHVTDVSMAGSIDEKYDYIHITLENNIVYELRMAKVGVGSRVTDEEEAYLTDISGGDQTLQTGKSTELVTEIRDRFNNPISGVLVNASAKAGSLSSDSDRTGIGGQVAFTYTAPSGQSGDDFVNVSFQVDPSQPGFNASAPENLTFSMTVEEAAGGGGEPPTVTIRSTSVTEVGRSNHDVDVEFEASDPNGDINNYTVELYEDSNKANLIDTVTDSNYDGSITTVTLNDRDSSLDNPFYVRVEVGDSVGNVGSAEERTN